MVYCGKPSPACGRCRTRRLKCDQGSPSCTQCMRAQVDCPGYRDPLDWSFRDQSEDIIRKSQQPTRKKRTTTSISTSVQNRTPLRNSLVYPVQELGKAHVFVNYMSGGPCGGHMSYLLPLMKDTRNSPVLTTALTAVGLAALSNIRLSPRMMFQARKEYTTALSQTNDALRDPVLSKRDDTLAAVVLLGMFEVMTCSDDSFIDRWIKHMDGAKNLIEHRGSEQLTRQEGLGLFTNLRAQISISQIYQEKYSSPTMTQLTQDAKQYRDPDDRMVDEVSRVVIQLTNFCAALKDGSITQPSEIIRRTLNLDADLMSILLTAPPSWGYKTVKVPLVDGEPVIRTVWGDSYHVYRNLSVSSVWNNARAARLLMHEMLLDAVKLLENSPGSSSLHQQQIIASQSRQIAHQLVDDICASVPFHLGMGMEDTYDWPSSNQSAAGESYPVASEQGNSHGSFSTTPLPWPSMPAFTSAERSSSLETDAAYLGAFLPNTNTMNSETHYPSPLSPSFEVSGAGGVTLVWPLLIAANSGFASPQLRKWIIGCLEKIGHSMGINQALATAQLLRDGMDSRAWMSPDGTPIHDTT
ncbi:hypothetical protein N7517_000037 [Penicillium concentricum]|uniref:Zn(2)-C6 fungal-type domain-containing protein n=1 Tax=Penicillium concentricum TaxID=293559 RepID=A0A9W9SP95_9EURO|nr:uncharacterized protein N7517_000037 [Penicillium concentricum]KAJ5382126.1 hypothetical protein N7517_000037 [Penicillium concentricum]